MSEERQATCMGDVVHELNALRHGLLDLTLNNRLLNFRASVRRTIEVTDEIPSEIYDLLVLNERTMYFRPASKAKAETLPDDPLEDQEEPSQIWEMPQEGAVKDKHRDQFLQTRLHKETLQKTLFYIDKESQAALDEQGYTVLYLAIGFLEWFEDDDPDSPHRAPLILVPVDLYRRSVGTQFMLKWSGEDILDNISLRARLRQEDVDLPEFAMPEDKGGIDAYLQQVKDSAKDKTAWAVRSDIILGFFSFRKFVMYKDLDPESWPAGFDAADNPIVQMLFEGAPPEDDAPPVVSSSIDQYHVVDADPSQIQVLEAVKSGRSLVVEGPPGTGKSQTILNIIAELLAAGKTVLFVSEKMAALQVVKSRLDRIGLGDYCLELHSRKAKKKEVLNQLESTLRMEIPRAPVIKSDYEDLDAIAAELNDYVSALHMPFAELKMSPFQLLGELTQAQKHFDEAGKDVPNICFIGADKFTQQELKEADKALEQLATLFDQVRPLADHPWRGCYPVEMFEDEVQQLAQHIGDCKDAIVKVRGCADALKTVLGADCENSLDNCRQLLNSADLIAGHEPVPLDALSNSAWDKENSKADALIKQLESFRRQRSRCLEIFRPESLESDAHSMIESHDQLSDSWVRFIMPGWYKQRTELKTIYKDAVPGDLSRVRADLALLQVTQDCREKLRKLEAEHSELFGEHWKGEDSDPEELTAHMNWILEIRELRLNDLLSDESLEKIAEGVDEATVDKPRAELFDALTEFDRVFNEVLQTVRPMDEIAFGKRHGELVLAELDEKLERWANNLDSLPRWFQYTQALNRCRFTIAASVLDSLQDPAIEGADLVPAFRARLFGELLKAAVRRKKSLKEFAGSLHNDKIRKFREMDQRVIELNRHRLNRMLYRRLPTLSNASANSQAGVLNSEFNRKRGHMPIRQLLLNCGQMIQRIKPCFMMSPLSIAQFLQPGQFQFDVVIFDEASQVRPEEAVGAFLRGRQLVVMGDSRQLPPTSFFDRLAGGDVLAEDESGVASEMESLLNLCRGRLSEMPLQWHYRSRHQSLINVSNHQSYDNRLLVFPSPYESHDFLGLHFEHLPDAVYDRGKTRINRGEARAVADAAVEHYRQYPDKTLGVGTFSVTQQLAIQQEIELRLKQEPVLEEHFSHEKNEPFFVKNLETIQGDERDVILISVGYGFDDEQKLSLNFGPLNQDGGERRLNVLVTRAREQCRVFANFVAQDLPFDTNDESAARGMRFLKAFLDYAQSRTLAGEDDPTQQSMPPFERTIAEFLSSEGFELKPRIGCARYRLDMAVVDPDQPNHYLLGLECDGDMYRKSMLPRDRDRLRDQVLGAMGWQLGHVWSIDWFRGRQQARKDLLELVDKAKSGELAPEIPEPDEIQFIEAEPNPEGPGNAEVVPRYRMCTELPLDADCDIPAMAPDELASAVVDIVSVEAPVHRDEVVRRIRDLAGLKKADQKLQDLIGRAIDSAESNDKIKLRHEFIWPNDDDHPVTVRKRESGNLELDWICDEEIGAAVETVLRRQFATPSDELAKESSYLLGFRRLSPETGERIQQVIDQMRSGGQLLEIHGGRLSLQ